MHVLVFGGSRNIGHLATLRLLNQGHSATLQLRNPKGFDNDAEIAPYIQSGKAEIVQGDALVTEDVERAWAKATENGRTVDYILFTIGATSGMASFNILKGVTINPPNLMTKAILNILCTMPASPTPPKIIAITSMGVTKDSPIPLLYKPAYGYLLRGPFADKLGFERILAHTGGRDWDDREPRDDITTVDGVKWQDRTNLPGYGSLEVLIIRPSALIDPKQKPAPSPPTDGNPDAKKEEEKPSYRVGGPELSGTYKISRDEVAHFIVENAMKNWDQFKGKGLTVSR